MTETEGNTQQKVDEKRVTRTVIRRRKKTAIEAVPEETEAGTAEAQEITPESATPQAAEPAAESATAVEKVETPEPAEKASPEEAAAATAEEEKAKAEKARPTKKVPAKRRSRADLLMEEYQRAGGLKRAGELATMDTESELPEPMERVFQPERRQRRAKRVIGKKDFKKTEITTPSARKRRLKIHDTIAVGDLAQAMGLKSHDILKKLMDLGTPMAINQTIDFATAEILAHEYGFEVENISFQEEEFIPAMQEAEQDAAHLVERAPVVTVMGHVDHGKTSLLDHIRKTKVASGEAGGITQHIGAYRISTAKGDIAFIDTPGHEAFTAMRARGAQVTDLVILVVAADDGVKPQTIEAIDHAKAAEVPIVVAINKIDKPGINIDNVKRELSEHGLVAEDWGGEIIMVPVSAITGEGIENLLEMISLQAEMLDLKANPKRVGSGYVLEAKLEKGRGPVATVLITDGSLQKGDAIVIGAHGGRVRAMTDSAGNILKEAGPATPVELTGLSGVPKAGDELHAVDSDADAKKIIEHRQLRAKEVIQMVQRPTSLEDIFAKAQEGKKVTLNIVLKSDVQGSQEAILGALDKLSTEKVTVNVIHAAVGAVSESDIMLAEASGALIIGFNVRPDGKALKVAENKDISIRSYRVIYELTDDIKKAMLGLLEPTYEEDYIGRAEVRDVFSISKVGAIAGCSVVDGKILRGSRVRVLRDGIIVYEGKIASLRRFKEDAKEVAQGYECGIGVENFNDIKVGDVLEAFQLKEIAAAL